jgi:hypothetical protein
VAFADALQRLLSETSLRLQLGDRARAYARTHWEREVVLQRAFEELESFAWQP